MRPYYSDGRLEIYHGDCREIVSTLPKLNLVLTDPPYAIGATRGEWSATASVAIGLHETAKRVCSTGSMLVFTTTSGRGIEFTQGAIGRKLAFNRLLLWQKKGGRSRARSPWRWDTVAILLFGRSPDNKRGKSSVFVTSAEYERETEHVAELPNGISEWLYEPFHSSEDVLTVCDPFMGSGRLLDAPVAAGQYVIGIDIDERNCEMAAKRLSVRMPRMEASA